MRRRHNRRSMEEILNGDDPDAHLYAEAYEETQYQDFTEFLNIIKVISASRIDREAKGLLVRVVAEAFVANVVRAVTAARQDENVHVYHEGQEDKTERERPNPDQIAVAYTDEKLIPLPIRNID